MKDITNIKTGDLVVGTSDPSKSVYSPTGSKIRDGIAIAGKPEDIASLQDSIMKSAVNMGGKKVAVEPKKAAKKKKGTINKEAYPITPVYRVDEEEYVNTPEISPSPEIKLETVIFENDFGKMRAKVENVLEHEQAFLLIFSNEDEVVFEPKIGETLSFYRNRVSYQVYYPGVIFDWTDGVKKAMILFKADTKNE
jgi:hypothetical protein